MSKQNKWQEELSVLKSILESSGLEKATKWGTDVFIYKGKNIVSYGGFKNFFSIWFYNGVFLKDKHQVLVNAQEGVTKALRQWRFTSIDEINPDLILAYISEAVQNEEEGKTWKPEKSVPITIPDILQEEFDKNPPLKDAFLKLAPYKQKEYTEHITSPKKNETKLLRLQKIVPMILAGIGIHDRYR